MSFGYQEAAVTESTIRPRSFTDLKLRRRMDELRRNEHITRANFGRSGRYEVWRKTRTPIQRITDLLFLFSLSLAIATIVIVFA